MHLVLNVAFEMGKNFQLLIRLKKAAPGVKWLRSRFENPFQNKNITNSLLRERHETIHIWTLWTLLFFSWYFMWHLLYWWSVPIHGHIKQNLICQDFLWLLGGPFSKLPLLPPPRKSQNEAISEGSTWRFSTTPWVLNTLTQPNRDGVVERPNN